LIELKKLLSLVLMHYGYGVLFNNLSDAME